MMSCSGCLLSNPAHSRPTQSPTHRNNKRGQCPAPCFSFTDPGRDRVHVVLACVSVIFSLWSSSLLMPLKAERICLCPSSVVPAWHYRGLWTAGTPMEGPFLSSETTSGLLQISSRSVPSDPLTSKTAAAAAAADRSDKTANSLQRTGLFLGAQMWQWMCVHEHARGCGGRENYGGGMRTQTCSAQRQRESSCGCGAEEQQVSAAACREACRAAAEQSAAPAQRESGKGPGNLQMSSTHSGYVQSAVRDASRIWLIEMMK